MGLLQLAFSFIDLYENVYVFCCSDLFAEVDGAESKAGRIQIVL